MAYVSVASLRELPEGSVLGVEAQGKRVCLAHCEGEVYAFADNCTHRDFPLSNGELDTDDCTITCEWHGATFDLKTGVPRCPPAVRPVPVFQTRVENGSVFVEIPE